MIRKVVLTINWLTAPYISLFCQPAGSNIDPEISATRCRCFCIFCIYTVLCRERNWKKIAAGKTWYQVTNYMVRFFQDMTKNTNRYQGRNSNIRKILCLTIFWTWNCLIFKFYHILNNFLDTTTTTSTTTITTDAAASHLDFSDWVIWIWLFGVWLRTPVSRNMWENLLRLPNATIVQRLFIKSCFLMGLNE